MVMIMHAMFELLKDFVNILYYSSYRMYSGQKCYGKWNIWVSFTYKCSIGTVYTPFPYFTLNVTCFTHENADCVQCFNESVFYTHIHITQTHKYTLHISPFLFRFSCSFFIIFTFISVLVLSLSLSHLFVSLLFNLYK